MSSLTRKPQQVYSRNPRSIPFKNKADRVLYNYKPHQFASPIQQVEPLPDGQARISYASGPGQIVSKSTLESLIDRAEAEQRSLTDRRLKSLENQVRQRPLHAQVSAEPNIRVYQGTDGSLIFRRPLPEAFRKRFLRSRHAETWGPGLVKRGSRFEKWLMKSAGGRRVHRYLNDPETKQFAKDLAVLGGLSLIAYKALPIAKGLGERARWAFREDPRGPLYDAFYPSRTQVFNRVYEASRGQKKGVFKSLSEAWKEVKKYKG